jgi:hypothetical protein
VPEVHFQVTRFYFDEGEEAEPAAAQAVAEVSQPRADAVDEAPLESEAPRLPAGYCLMDTGCAFDLVEQASTQGCRLHAAKKLNFGATSGTILAQTVATFQRAELNQKSGTPRPPLDVTRALVWSATRGGRVRESAHSSRPFRTSVGVERDQENSLLGSRFSWGCSACHGRRADGLWRCGRGCLRDKSGTGNLPWCLCPRGNLSCWSTAHARSPRAVDKAAPGHVGEIGEDPRESGAPNPDPVDFEAGVPLAAERRN